MRLFPPSGASLTPADRPYAAPDRPHAAPDRPATAAHRADLVQTLRARRAASTRSVPRADHAVVVFGAPARDDGRPGPSLASRLSRALAALEADPSAAVVVVSGGAVKGTNEAEAMRRWLVGQGVAPSRVVVEPEARFTLENAELSAALVANTGADRVTLVTEAFHMGRASALMQQALRDAGVAAELRLAPATDANPGAPGHASEPDKTARDLRSQRLLHALARDETPPFVGPPAPGREWVF